MTQFVRLAGIMILCILLIASGTLVSTGDELAVKEKKAGNTPAPPLVMFGGDASRNMANLKDRNIPANPIPGGPDQLWVADLGTRAYCQPIVAGGKVLCGTNNERPRNKRDIKRNADGDDEPIDLGVLMCFDARTGRFEWQAVHPKLGPVNDWPREGICSTPAIEGNRVYYVSNRCTVVCVDLNGFADGNQGDQNETFKQPTDADIVWEFDMIKEGGVFPHNMAAGSPLIVGDLLYTVTANGMDEGHTNLPAPDAPSFVALNKRTGKLVWRNSDPGENVMHAQWSNPVYGEFGGRRQVIFPGGDGWLRAFVPETGERLWRFDANPKSARYEVGGVGTKSEFIGTPVVADGKVYIGLGQDPEHTSGVGHFWCIDPTGKTGDISAELVDKIEKEAAGRDKVTGKPNPASAVVWHYGGADDRKFLSRDYSFGRTMSTACVVDGVVYIAELVGCVHCLDAKTGKKYWQYDLKSSIWGSCYYVDGKVYVATENGDLFVFKHDKNPRVIDELDIPDARDAKDFNSKRLIKRKQVEDAYLLHKIESEDPIRSTPVVADGVLYVATEKRLYAFGKK
ncbi:PQQ-binding-like beta-propeller repeat protein [Fimbriiglobus ruber]|uniref:Pyrrolo-quinoline quinone repeat domain-containing protein n=1 Tax=Fimbriiglobus ruber TaxID=1908690 RepID=A0A225D515_9BACT|nr:PQQ-binding-like beta-propeller repeat protein [Fimbriiglobus ruber]OWK36691.1 hypothetical protein FRUB_09254 [Fimbriiglobus ruber]